MSVAEIKEQVAQMTEDEQLEIVAWIQFLMQQNDPAFLPQIRREMAEMEAGKVVKQAEVERLHRELLAQGR